MEGAFDDLKIIDEICKNNGIEVSYNKLLINKNYNDKDYLNKIEPFNILHPRVKNLYLKNSISLTQIVKKINHSYQDYIFNQSIPICVLSEKLKKENLLDKIIENYINNYKMNLKSNKDKNLNDFCIQTMLFKKILFVIF